MSRLAEDGLFDYDGQVSQSERFHDYLTRKSDIFSPSDLDLLANCPMRYLFERLYGLRPLEEPGEEFTPREMGSHLHVILSRLFDGLKTMGVNVHDLGLARAFDLAREIGEDHFKRYALGDQFPYLEYQMEELLLGLEGGLSPPAEREGVLASLLRFEEKEFRGRLPWEMEYGFGYKGETPVHLGRSLIRGYKEENPFAQVLRERMEDNRGLDLSGVEMIDHFVDRLIALTETGSFHHSVDELKCDFCDFKYACFRDSRRMNFLIDQGIEQAIYGGKKI